MAGTGKLNEPGLDCDAGRCYPGPSVTIVIGSNG
jgi:hypothetical protein